MAATLIPRRHMLALTLFSCAGTVLPSAAFVPAEPAWLTDFSKQLAQLSVRIRRESGTGGEVGFHCEMSDAAAWTKSFMRLAGGSGAGVRASGSALIFSREGYSVKVTMSRV